MPQKLLRALFFICCAALLAASSQSVAASTLCVNKAGSGGCYSTINMAVSHAMAGDTIKVGPGTYKEDVVIGKSLSLLGAESGASVIDATGLSNGIFVDGFDNAGLAHVTIAGFTVKNALYEGILAVTAWDVTIRDNRIIENDKVEHTFTGEEEGCPGQPAFERNETGDCGGGLHFIGVWNSIVTDNSMTDNADGFLISDETAESHDILVTHNNVSNNPEECGIVLASHAPVGSNPPAFAPHFGIDHVTISENVVSRNGVSVGGAGVGVFSDGAGPGIVTNNVVIHNKLTDNGIGGFSLHTHVGPSFGLPRDNLDGNMVIENYIAGNLADEADTATPGRVGININSGGGGSPVNGTLISGNVIRDEDIDIAINTPGVVNLHLNDLLGGKVGVGNICAFDNASCAGSVNATQNYWGCRAGPGSNGCTSVTGSSVTSYPFLTKPATGEDDNEQGDNQQQGNQD